ncbi:MAG: gliding motility-associated C-terminal domain-containing protein [Bacteroidetes bacterium]|nr:gliding motility-associated C-terminal domain-containing protein [Bacteroidota bacterium]
MPNRLSLRSRCLLFLALLTLPARLFATHQRAAEITFRHIGALTYEITLISYTYTLSPVNASRDYLQINWGDGTSDLIPRVQSLFLPDTIRYNKYIGQHTFAGPSTFVISCEDPNRNFGIMNIPNSVNIPMFIYSELTISPYMQPDNSPILLVPPVDNACVGQPFYHNPGAYDPDGDSLSYKLVTCLGFHGMPIPGYTLPPPDNSCHINPLTGDFSWISPEQQGEYNIAILIEEWRDGIRIGSVERDMQIHVVACNDHPPVIDSIADTCVEAGHTMRFPVTAHDPDTLNIVTLTALGGPFILSLSPAYMTPDTAQGQGHVSSIFHWPTICRHVRKKPYQVYFKAQDDGSPVRLVDIKSMNILVIGPRPMNLGTAPAGNDINLTWDTYSCTNAKGFYVYRKSDSTGYIPGYCQTGVPAYLGYSRIMVINDITATSYLDDNNGAGLNRGIKYCYLVTAFFQDGAEGYASNEACAELKKDIPVITNVSINTTDLNQGSIYLAWSKPTQMDTIQAPGPYKYLIYRSRSDNPQQYVIIDSLFNLNDTLKTDTLLNTVGYSFRYRIDLYNLTPGKTFFMGSSQPASSMYLRLSPSDKKMRMYWSNDVPWNNNTFAIYRSDAFSGSYDSVGFSVKPFYIDRLLINGTAYYYKIKSRGAYSSGGFIVPIINLSQKTGGVPVDNDPPCPQKLSDSVICKDFTNYLRWSNPGDTCGKDIAKYYIYFSPSSGIQPALIDSILNPYDTFYIHKQANSVVGCYSVIAIDSAGNRSDFSNTLCVDYTACPLYTLPNFFTPNGDGYNDLFVPITNSSVDHVDMKIFNRWGRIVYKTSDPEINWDGNDINTKSACADGTYLFICDVYEITLSGIQQRTIQGSITLLR